MALGDRPRGKQLLDLARSVPGAGRFLPSTLSSATHARMPTLDNKQLMDLFKKDLGGSAASSMFGGGWQGANSSRYRTGTGRLAALLNAYGGTQDSVVWVFACVSLIGSTAGSYPWRYVDDDEETIENGPADLTKLLKRPNPDMSWFDLMEIIATDLEMVGNCYVLKNELNGLGQPKTLFRLRPDRVKIVVAPDGTEVGYVYSASDTASLPIPYEYDEVIHFRYPNPLDDHYGMGTVEAISSELDLHTSQKLHLTGYFQNGARISGVLTIPETMSDTQFERLKDSWRENYAGPANAYKLLVAEGAADYKQISQTPVASGVVDLAKMSKDEILSGFGVPAPLLGGILENANYKMEEAQHIFLRTMTPKSRRISERLSIDLTSRWGVEIRIDSTANEPPEVRIAHAKEMLGTGATLNQVLEAAGLPLVDGPEGDIRLIPNNLIPISVAGLPPRPGASIPIGQNPEAGGPRPGQALEPNPAMAGGEQAALASGEGTDSELENQLREMEAELSKEATGRREAIEALERLSKDLHELAAVRAAEPVTDADVVDEPSVKHAAMDRQADELREVGAIMDAHVRQVGEDEDRKFCSGSTAIADRPAVRKYASASEAFDDLTGLLARGKGSKAGTQEPQGSGDASSWDPPELPAGFESTKSVMSAEARAVREHQAQVLRVGYATFGDAFKGFFKAQRDRVMQSLSTYGTSGAHRRSGKAKSDLTPDGIFDTSAENESLLPVYLAALDEVGKAALPMPMSLGSGISWDLVNPRIEKLRTGLGEKIVQVNQTTKDAISEQVAEGLRRGYSVVQIANGVPSEKFPGVLGVFDDASGYRAEMIARTESAFAYNGAQVADYASADVGYVQILDGIGDEICASADGAIWTLDQYGQDPIGHPNCSRTAIPTNPPAEGPDADVSE